MYSEWAVEGGEGVKEKELVVEAVEAGPTEMEKRDGICDSIPNVHDRAAR